MSARSLYPSVWLVTAHGRQELECHGDERVIDLLDRHRVPWSGVSTYMVSRSGQVELRPCLASRLSELGDAAELRVYFNRNINPFLFSHVGAATVPSSDPAAGTTEYLYQRFDDEHGRTETFIKKLSPEECKEIVSARVEEAIASAMPDGGDLVVGVSGGGDSNALLEGLARLRGRGVEVHPIIIMGIPEWDAGVPRARSLCDHYELDLVVMDEAEVRGLLGMPESSMSLVERFEREFKGDDFEFLGTLLVRLALIAHAERIGTRYICTGLNLEDVACEAMFRVSSGLAPAPFPVRQIGNVTLVMPLWMCPKRIIDGCFPRLSLENYDARYPCFSLGRNLYYSVVHSMQSAYPGYLEQLTRGLSELSQREPVTTYVYDEQLGFHVERMVPFSLRERFRRMLGRAHDESIPLESRGGD